MKKSAFTLLFLIISFFASNAKAEDCPFGLVNDPAPGSCARYVDGDSNNLCDLSEVPLQSDYQVQDKSAIQYLSEDELKKKTVKEVAEAYGIETSAYRAALSEFLKIDVKGGDLLLDLHDTYGLCSGVAANIALGIKDKRNLGEIPEHDLISGEEVQAKKVYEVAELYGVDQDEYANALAQRLGTKIRLTEKIEYYHDNFGLEASVAKDIARQMADRQPEISKASPTGRQTARYKMVFITIVLVALYLGSSFMVAKKKIALITQRRFWNVILLFSFLATSVLGMFLVIRVNWGIVVPLPFNMLYWHVETGTVMLIVTIFHLSWHWRYYACLFKRTKGEDC